MSEGLVLIHHGVKGQKWGVRRKHQNKHTKSRRYSQIDRDIDKQLYGKSGVQRIEKRMKKGNKHSTAVAKEIGRQTVLGMMSSAVMMDVLSGGTLSKVVINTGKHYIMNKQMQRKMMKTVVKITQNKKYNPIDVAYTIMDA